MTPNIWLHECFGKVIFCLIDMMVGYMIYSILQQRKCSSSLLYACTYLFNPIVINISTRGNADQLVVSLVLACLYCLNRKRVDMAAIWFGLAVHTKIYPIIYAPALYLLLDKYDYFGKKKPKKRSWMDRMRDFFSAERVRFTILSAFTCIGLTALFYFV